MAEHDKEDLIQIVQHQRAEAATYWRQWILWLSVGSAGAAVAVISLAAKLPDPNYAFLFFMPSIWSFLVGVIAAATCLPLAALRAERIGEHFAAAHNREQGTNAIRSLPEMFSAPKSIAKEMNAPRDELIKQVGKANVDAETAWNWRVRLNFLMIILLSISAISFLFGVSWPLIQVSRGGTLTPSETLVKIR